MDIAKYNSRLKYIKFIIIKLFIILNLLFWGFFTYTFIKNNITSYLLFKFFNVEALRNLNIQPASITGKMLNGNIYYFTSNRLLNYLEGFITKDHINFEGVLGGIKTANETIELLGNKAIFNQSTKEFIITENVRLNSPSYSIILENLVFDTIKNQLYSTSVVQGRYGSVSFVSQGFFADNNVNSLTLIGPIEIEVTENK